MPGITAASGCSAYSGIPLTHRDYAQSVRLVTGHLKPAASWTGKTGGRKTDAGVLHGAESGSDYPEKLIAFGMQADMPVALVENGTSVKQRVVHGVRSSVN